MGFTKAKKENEDPYGPTNAMRVRLLAIAYGQLEWVGHILDYWLLFRLVRLRREAGPGARKFGHWHAFAVSAASGGVKQLAELASVAADRGLACLVSGGHAVITHGFARSTFDLDLLVRRPDRESWQTLARDLGYELYHEGPTFIQFDAPATGSFPLDLMFVNEETFAKMQADAVMAPGGLAQVQVVSLMHLLALKCHAVKHGHAGRIVKDAEDVIRLMQNNRLDPNGPEIRELFFKHGTEDFYEKIRTACRVRQ